jgi:hypothetical protein
MVRIGREELRLLRENSKQVEKLAENNARLVDELEICREASSRVDRLERENKLLAGDLEQKLKQPQQGPGTPQPRIQPLFKSTPGPSEPPSSAVGIEANESKTVTKEKYQSLVSKYNTLCEKYADLKDVKKKIQDILTIEREKIKNWGLYAKEQDNTIIQKNDKIQRLQEEIQRLRSRSKDQRELLIPLHENQDKAGENFVPTKPLLRDHGSDVEVAASSPMEARPPKLPAKEFGAAGQAPQGLEDSDRQESALLEHVDLPTHCNVEDELVEDTEFEPIEAYHASSTEGASDPLSSHNAAGDEQAAEGNPTTESPTSPGFEFVSCRSVKKRKVRHESPDQKIKSEIKVETIGSSPIGLAAFRILNPNESIDLDDIGEKVDTPRKQRKLLELSHQGPRSMSYSLQSAIIRKQSHDHSNSVDVEKPGHSFQESLVQRRDSVLQPRSTNRQILPRTSDDRAPKKRRIASDEAVGELVEDGEISIAAWMPRRQISDTSDRLDVLLAKPSPPKKVLGSARLACMGNQQVRPMRAIAASDLARELQHTLQEDPGDWRLITPNIRSEDSRLSSPRGLGRESTEASRPSSKSSFGFSAEPSRPSSSSTLRGSSEASRPTSKETLRVSVEPPEDSSIINETSYLPPRRPPLASTYFAKKNPRAPLETPRPSSRQTTQPSRTSTVKPRLLHQDNDATDWEIDPDQELLRVRALDKLNLHDFKVNPNYNQGYDFAFTEVVRDQTTRKCLQGCSKPECCGHKFRALVEINRNTGKPPTLSQEEADEILLDNFMGDNAYKLRNMSKAEKEELLLQAKTRDIANKYGRHRHAYERRTSPPGFWRTDFPTTQEEIEDREKAKEKAREEVAKRYKEAMRPGGAFIFRDE